MHQQRRLTDFFNSPSSSIAPSTPPIFATSPARTPTRSAHKRKGAVQLNGRVDKKSRLQQTIIDAGQKRIGLEHCVKCGMVYNVDDGKDVADHKAFHNRFTEKKAFRVTSTQLDAWKRGLYFEPVFEPINGCIFRLNSESNATLKRRFEEIVETYVNEELGYCAELPVWDKEGLRQACVFISEPVAVESGEPAFIGGLVLIDRVDRVMLMPQHKIFHGNFLGVNRIWIHSQLRRRGLAAHLLDVSRRLMVTGGVLARSRVAFSEPTDAGIQLAIAYVNQGVGKENGGGKYITYALDLPRMFTPQKKMAMASKKMIKTV